MSVPVISQTGPLSMLGNGVHDHATSISRPSRCSQRPSQSAEALVRIAEDAVARCGPFAVRDVAVPEEVAAGLVRRGSRACARRPCSSRTGARGPRRRRGRSGSVRSSRSRSGARARARARRSAAWRTRLRRACFVRARGSYGAVALGKRGRPSSGIGSQGAAYATNWRHCGRMPGSPSNVPRRTPRSSRRRVAAPERAAARRSRSTSASPSGGAYSRTSSSPATSAERAGATRACADAAVPVRRWQRVQWQYDARDERLVDLEADAAAEAAAGERELGHASRAYANGVGTLAAGGICGGRLRIRAAARRRRHRDRAHPAGDAPAPGDELSLGSTRARVEDVLPLRGGRA